MIRMDDIVATTDGLHADDLDRWIAAALVTPLHEAGEAVFTPRDCARVDLLCTLHYTLEIEDETLPVVVSLLDQLYRTRRQLHTLAAAVLAQDATVQQDIVAALAAQMEVMP